MKTGLQLQQGQTIVEYAIIGVLVIVILAAATTGLQKLLKDNVEATRNGFNTESSIPK